MNASYVITSDNIVIVSSAGIQHIPVSFPGYASAARALVEGRHEEAVRCATLAGAVKAWHPGFSVSADLRTITKDDVPLPAKLSDRLLAMVSAGESPDPLFRFWERLARNPSQRSVEQLYDFLGNNGIPISQEGFVLAYKSVRSDYMDFYSSKFRNRPGDKLSMPREGVDPNPSAACSSGFHVGALEYASGYGDDRRRIVICRVDPADVVSVPADHRHQKMRVCAYEVIGHHGGGLMSSTTTSDDREVEEVEEAPPDQSLPDLPASTDRFPRRYERLASMSTEDLLELSLERLRELAGKAFKIVGASKVRGGKAALVQLIDRVRGA